MPEMDFLSSTPVPWLASEYTTASGSGCVGLLVDASGIRLFTLLTNCILINIRITMDDNVTKPTALPQADAPVVCMFEVPKYPNCNVPVSFPGII
jgi:hypothetical protein